jgi:hypothetical protein
VESSIGATVVATVPRSFFGRVLRKTGLDSRLGDTANAVPPRTAEAFLPSDIDARTAEEKSRRARDAARAKVPAVWLIGKTGAGKSAIVRTLTGATEAEVGTGYRPCTETAQRFDFPAEAPIIAFLDTRGLAEPDYAPAADIAYARSVTHLTLAVMKADDAVQGDVLKGLAEIRKIERDWPIVVAQTGLHNFYAQGEGHPAVYPFATPAEQDCPEPCATVWYTNEACSRRSSVRPRSSCLSTSHRVKTATTREPLAMTV